MILGIDHVGIAVTDAAAAREAFAVLVNAPGTAIEELASQAVRVCFVPVGCSAAAEGDAHRDPDPARLELLEPATPASPVARFLDRRGEGLHHVCFAVDDVAGELARLTAAGFEAIDPNPRPGHGGLVAFLHPRSARGVLVELLQRTGGDG